MATSVKDQDLLSLQEARTLLRRAREAWNTLGHFSQEKIDRIVAAAAEAASNASLELGKLAVERSLIERGKELVRGVQRLIADGTLGYAMLIAERPAAGR